jgi:pimeloyl-ACP methyl ester carboxylesterase
VLAIHCTLGHGGAWRGIGAALETAATVTAIDLPSHGKSADWDGVANLHALCTRAASGFLTARMDIVGHSFGATVALRLAVESPHLVRSLTLIEPVFFAAAMVEAPDIAAEEIRSSRPCRVALAQGDMWLAAQHFNAAWGNGSDWAVLPMAMRRYMTERMHLIPGQSSMIYDDDARLLAPGRLDRADMPCLLLKGDRSPPVIDAINSALARRLSRAERITIAGAGHMVPITHPTQVAQHMVALFEMAQE